MKILSQFTLFVLFILSALFLLGFGTYKGAKKAHFYESEALMEAYGARSGAEFEPLSALIRAPENTLHSSSLVQTKRGVMALFFAGSREGAADVKIYQSFYDAQNNEWSKAQSILDAKTLSKMSGKFIKKLGNPLAFEDINGKVHFFVVGVSLGGWATSKVYQLEFDKNLKPKFKGELKLGAFLNFSHLVRTPAIVLDEGGFILPLYHELARKYALLGFFDEEANLLYTKRINTLKNQLQPSLLAHNVGGAVCLAFFRNHKSYENAAFLQHCGGRGTSWQEPIKTNLKSYDSSSVLGLIFVDYKDFKRSEVLLVHNDGGKENPRSKLSLFWLKDETKGEFVKLFTLDEGAEVSYPTILSLSNSEKMPNDRIFISYTLDRKVIKTQILSVKAIQEAIDAKRDEK